jgi:hypothetical protein
MFYATNRIEIKVLCCEANGLRVACPNTITYVFLHPVPSFVMKGCEGVEQGGGSFMKIRPSVLIIVDIFQLNAADGTIDGTQSI